MTRIDICNKFMLLKNHILLSRYIIPHIRRVSETVSASAI